MSHILLIFIYLCERVGSSLFVFKVCCNTAIKSQNLLVAEVIFCAHAGSKVIRSLSDPRATLFN